MKRKNAIDVKRFAGGCKTTYYIVPSSDAGFGKPEGEKRATSCVSCARGTIKVSSSECVCVCKCDCRCMCSCAQRYYCVIIGNRRRDDPEEI